MDYYSQNPDRLEGQPKRTIGDYVAQNGILVPRRFETIQEAKDFGVKVFLRSEHPQEYDGASGLLNSFDLPSPDFGITKSSSIQEVKKQYFANEEKDPTRSKYIRYCNLLGLDQDQFKEETSFSVWEYIDGVNWTIVADSSVPDRYHAMRYHETSGGRVLRYSIIDNLEISKSYGKNLPRDADESIEDLIALYEEIRHLDHFDSDHCPIMEFQTQEGKNYFLQYHRTRDFVQSTFTLDREMEEGEVLIPFVRGATPESGETYRVIVHTKDFSTGDLSLDNLDGAYDIHTNTVFSEIQTRKRTVQMIATKYFDFDFDKVVTSHISRSKLFKPQISIVHHKNDLIPEGKWNQLMNIGLQEKKTAYITVKIVSDGKKGYMRLLD